MITRGYLARLYSNKPTAEQLHQWARVSGATAADGCFGASRMRPPRAGAGNRRHRGAGSRRRTLASIF